MLAQGGTVKVLDFGMGSIVDDPDQTRLTSTGVSVGTARYKASSSLRPEPKARRCACHSDRGGH
ncbi:hypothetical protein [Streptomyces sp. MH13]|uniref:hypothetical protein n=1 Tax=unclassified Streptomyces TaxID=2593676 RepID=UPI003CE82646